MPGLRLLGHVKNFVSLLLHRTRRSGTVFVWKDIWWFLLRLTRVVGYDLWQAFAAALEANLEFDGALSARLV
ncbi:MAG: hypothetical protein ACP5LD_14870 [Desulfomonilaceae bacterium]